MKRMVLILLALLLVLGAAGCGQANAPINTPLPVPDEPDATPTPTPAPTPEATAVPSPEPTPEPEPAYRNPFNGAPLEEPFSNRPVIAMLDNHTEAQPHCGNSQADILYEVLVEGSITRMMGVFSDINAVSKLGPVRSIRPYYLDLALSYDALICHAGGSDAAYSRISAERLNNIDGVRGSYKFYPFYRDPNRLYHGVEHALFTTGPNVLTTVAEKGYRTGLNSPETYDSGLKFSRDACPAEGEDAASVTVTFYPGYKTTDFRYDADTGRYAMRQFGVNYTDGNTGETVSFENLIVFSAEGYVLDSYGRRSFVLVNTTGKGYYANGGKLIPITWSRGANSGPFHYYREDGTELSVSPGHTYIGIIPRVNAGISYS